MPRILLVEDDVDVQLLVEHVLLDAGHAVDAVGTMADGLSLLDTRPYDLILTDNKLPDGAGTEIAGRAIENGCKALMFTGYAFTLPREARDYEVLLKPLRPSEIVEAVERVLQS